MSDRTQTLSVELTREEIDRLDLCVGAGLSEDTVEHPAPFALKTARDKLKAALSQPEHQGDETAQKVIVDFLTDWRFCPVATASNPSRSCLEDAANQLLAALPAQPPAPVLSDEERSRLVAAVEDAICLIKGDPATQSTAFRANLRGDLEDQLPFLRNLASQEHRGEEGFEHCNRCGRGNTVWFAPSSLWNAVMRGGSINGDPIYNDLVCATCFMHLAEEQGVATHFKVFAEQINVELETTTPSGRIWDEERQLWTDPPQPPAGEVETHE